MNYDRREHPHACLNDYALMAALRSGAWKWEAIRNGWAKAPGQKALDEKSGACARARVRACARTRDQVHHCNFTESRVGGSSSSSSSI